MTDLTGDVLKNKKMDASVLFDTVTISIHCGDDYEAQVVFDHITDTIKAGGKIEIGGGSLSFGECSDKGEGK